MGKWDEKNNIISLSKSSAFLHSLMDVLTLHYGNGYVRHCRSIKMQLMRYKHEIPQFFHSIDADPIKGAIPGVLFCYALR